ncbi:MAG: sel1 repeat family protein [Synergistaceae bacterium]|nr:sel1 repeat family protein [Synergistaceae bacterium]
MLLKKFFNKFQTNKSSEFATTIENPVLAKSIADSYYYLNSLRTQNNGNVHYERIGSMSGKNGEIIDGYHLYFEVDGEECSLTIYINPYAKINSTEAPKGLKLSTIQRLEEAAEFGDAEAMAELGYIYFNGKGVRQDDYKAFEWFKKAVEHGSTESYFYLGLIYSDGKVVPQNYAEALKWYRKAAEHGEAAAETNIGLMYSKGRGVEQNFQEAVKWYHKAAERGYALAQYNLGEMYVYGKGVEQNITQAKKWFTLAAKQGFIPAQRNLEILKSKIFS